MKPHAFSRMTVTATRLAVVLFVVGGSSAVAEEYQVYRGLLHAHTMFSDGSGTPVEAYAMARAAGCDFFAVTPHNHKDAEDGAKERRDGILIATDHRLYESNDSFDITTDSGTHLQVVSVQRAAREAATATYVPLYGEEFSTISSGNHVNVIGYGQVLTNPNGDFRGLFQTLDQAVAAGKPMPIVQLNHPDVQADLFYGGADPDTKKKKFNDYGFDEFGQNFSDMVAAGGKYVVLVELLSGPAMAKVSNPNFHYPDPHESDYYFYLAQGFHISPSVGQDNHYKTWGNSSSARMGVLATALTKDALFTAIRANRTFATEDKNLSVKFSANGSVMGSCLELAAGSDLNFEVALSDPDEASADYDVVLVRGEVSPQRSDNLHRLVASDGIIETEERHGNGSVTFSTTSSGHPEFFYVRVTQGNGDRSWTAPVWINYPRAGVALVAAGDVWVWSGSASSKVYHHEWCKVADTISPHNLRSGTTPPEGRTLHDCKRPEGDGH